MVFYTIHVILIINDHKYVCKFEHTQNQMSERRLNFNHRIESYQHLMALLIMHNQDLLAFSLPFTRIQKRSRLPKRSQSNKVILLFHPTIKSPSQHFRFEVLNVALFAAEHLTDLKYSRKRRNKSYFWESFDDTIQPKRFSNISKLIFKLLVAFLASLLNSVGASDKIIRNMCFALCGFAGIIL